MGLKLKIVKGATFRKQLRYESEPYIYKPITAIDSSAPCRLHVPDHGLLQDQLFFVQGASGLVKLNSESLDTAVWFRATVESKDVVSINKVNARAYPAHTPNTGDLIYRTVVDLTGYTARMAIKDKVGGTVLCSLTTQNNGIAIDAVNQYIILEIADTLTTTFDWVKGVYDLEICSPTGVVIRLIEGEVAVSKEVTTQ